MRQPLTGVLTLLATMTLTTLANGSNFSYSQLNINASAMAFDEPLELGSYEVSSFPGARLGGGFQFTDFFALTLDSGAYVQDLEADNVEVTISRGTLSADFPIAAGSRIDVIPSLGFLFMEVEACSSNVCISESEDSGYYGLAARLWAIDRRLEVNGNFLVPISEEFSTELGLGARVFFGNHSIQADYLMPEEDSSISTLGYRYTWR